MPHGMHPGMHPGMRHGPNALQNISPEEYFAALSHNFSNNRAFWWRELLEGNASSKMYEKWGIECMRSFSCHTLKMFVGTIQMMLNFDFVPMRMRHITSGTDSPIQVCSHHSSSSFSSTTAW